MENANQLLSDDYEIQNNTKKIGYFEDPYNILESEIPQMSRNSTSVDIQLDIRQKLENLACTQRLPYSSNILEYWKHLQVKDPEIHILMKTVLATVISQSSVERSFNALSTILAKEKTKMSKQALNNLLLVKLNAEILTQVEA